MKSLGNSSATATPPPPAPTPATASVTPPRKAFALTGRSVVFDATTHAVRSDLADVRLADLVFAPHYAAPMPRRIAVAAELRTERDAGSPVLATLAAGDVFEVLDLIGEAAWGVAPAVALVGYIPAAHLAAADKGDAA